MVRDRRVMQAPLSTTNSSKHFTEPCRYYMKGQRCPHKKCYFLHSEYATRFLRPPAPTAVSGVPPPPHVLASSPQLRMPQLPPDPPPLLPMSPPPPPPPLPPLPLPPPPPPPLPPLPLPPPPPPPSSPLPPPPPPLSSPLPPPPPSSHVCAPSELDYLPGKGCEEDTLRVLAFLGI